MIRPVFLIAAFMLAMPAAAQDVNLADVDRIKAEAEAQQKIEEELKAKRDKVNSEISALRKDLKSMSTKLTDLEAEHTGLENELAALEVEKQTIGTSITQNKATLTKLLAALQRVESNPPPALAARPDDAAAAARAGLLMAGISDQLAERVGQLRGNLVVLTELGVEIEQKQTALKSSQSKLSSQRGKIQTRVNDKNQLERSLSADFDTAQKRRLELAAEAQSLAELIERLEFSSRDIIPRLKPDPNAPEISSSTSAPSRATAPVTFEAGALRFSSAKGDLFSPVTGSLSKRYSSSHPGIAIKVKDGAQVHAPAAGRVEFAGPFKNFENVVILNVGDGYFILLTGLGQLHVQSDSAVTAGETVGLMPVNSASNEKLYIEVRKNGSTIDPIPWFGTSFAKPGQG